MLQTVTTRERREAVLPLEAGTPDALKGKATGQGLAKRPQRYVPAGHPLVGNQSDPAWPMADLHLAPTTIQDPGDCSVVSRIEARNRGCPASRPADPLVGARQWTVSPGGGVHRTGRAWPGTP